MMPAYTIYITDTNGREHVHGAKKRGASHAHAFSALAQLLGRWCRDNAHDDSRYGQRLERPYAISIVWYGKDGKTQVNSTYFVLQPDTPMPKKPAEPWSGRP